MLILPHPLTDFEIKKYYENDASFNGVYSRNNLAKIKDVVYMIHLDEYKTVLWQEFIEYEHTIQECVDTFVLDVFILS